jgi:hypothetical protein
MPARPPQLFPPWGIYTLQLAASDSVFVGKDRYRERVAGINERVIGHVESMEADEILSRSSQVEKIAPDNWRSS